MNPHRIRNTVGLWQSQLPAIKPYYAVKCNPEPRLLNALYDSGVNFDCASERELLAVKELAREGVAPRVIYANPCKSTRSIEVAKDLGAPVTVVDSAEEVAKLGDYRGGALIRIAVDDTTSAMPFSTKFGAQTQEIGVIATEARRKGLALKGISFHVGSGCSDGGAYTSAIHQAYEALLTLRGAGHGDAATIDIGGGYLANEADFRLKAISIRAGVNLTNATEKDHGRPALHWIAEPGRFFATKAFDFYVQVIGKKTTPGSKGYKYTLDDSLYGQFSSILFDYQEPTWVRVGRRGEAERKRGPGVLFGRTCDSVDVIARATDMEELEVGDWLWFPNMGAYTRATASEFNGFPTPEVFVEEGDRVVGAAIRRPEEEFEIGHAAPRGVTRMPPVSARAFWTAGPGGKN